MPLWPLHLPYTYTKSKFIFSKYCLRLWTLENPIFNLKHLCKNISVIKLNCLVSLHVTLHLCKIHCCIWNQILDRLCQNADQVTNTMNNLKISQNLRHYVISQDNVSYFMKMVFADIYAYILAFLSFQALRTVYNPLVCPLLSFFLSSCHT